MTLSAILDNKEKHNNSVGLSLANFPRQCSDAFFSGRNLGLSREKRHNAVFLCGTGGSALAGDMIFNLGLSQGKVPFFVIRDHTLPPWVDESSLVITISYSGNTAEALSCYDQTKERKATSVVVTSGGLLGDAAKKDGAFTIEVPKGFQPRMATLHMALPLVLLLREAGLLEIADAAIVETYVNLCSLSQRWGIENPAVKNRAKATSVQLFNKMPLIWGSAGLTDAGARNFKNQLNETAEAAAFYGVVPEVGHNEIMSLNKKENIGLILLRCQQEDPKIVKVFETAKIVLVDKTAMLSEVWLPGNSLLATLSGAFFFGDLTAYYLSLLKGVDPTDISLINSFKARLRR
ncbi:MAG: bifunctional phosphoglucose/phosphomannose isomerase [Bacillota bacterium]|nr:bifunctional phosphoglucose/phosphomannose isomerase [Bacillota bacterium]